METIDETLQKWKNILFDGITLDPCGFGVVNRNILLSLKNKKYNIQTNYSIPHSKKHLIPKDHLSELEPLSYNLVPSNSPLIVSFPVGFSFINNSLKKLMESRYVIFFTMTEVGELNDKIIEEIRYADEIWVPTDFDLIKFKKYHDRVFKINLFVDNLVYADNIPPRLDIKSRCKGFTFLFCGSGIYRKGLLETCESYIKSFTKADDVTLILLTKEIKLAEIYEKLNVSQMENLPDILIIDEYVHESELSSIYACADVLVLPSRGEGWSLPAIEFASMGKPSIITNFGGQTEFLDNNGAWLIDVDEFSLDKNMYTLYKTEQYNGIKFPVFNERFMNIMSVYMKEAYRDRDLTLSKGKYIKERVSREFTSENTSSSIDNRLKDLFDELNLGLVKPKNHAIISDIKRESRKEKFVNFKNAIKTKKYFEDSNNIENHFKSIFSDLKKFFVIVDDFDKFKILYKIISAHPEIYLDPYIFKYDPEILDLTLAQSNKIFYYDAWLRYSLKNKLKIILGGVIHKNEIDNNLLKVSDKIIVTCDINISADNKILRVNYDDIYDMDKINYLYGFLGVVQKTRIIK